MTFAKDVAATDVLAGVVDVHHVAGTDDDPARDGTEHAGLGIETDEQPGHVENIEHEIDPACYYEPEVYVVTDHVESTAEVEHAGLEMYEAEHAGLAMDVEIVHDEMDAVAAHAATDRVV